VTAVPALHGPDGSEPVVGPGTADAAVILGASIVVPVHYEGWGHFTEGGAEVRQEFDRRGIGARLHVLAPGRPTALTPTGVTGNRS
jgi:L-ascorbate metabolism protein UlaG (beta-lactamase superfamily)